jgi:hypothetical protein
VLFRDRFLLVNTAGAPGSGPTLGPVTPVRPAIFAALLALAGALVLGLAPEVTAELVPRGAEVVEDVDRVAVVVGSDALDEGLPRLPAPARPTVLAAALVLLLAGLAAVARARLTGEVLATFVVRPAAPGAVGRRGPPTHLGTRLD